MRSRRTGALPTRSGSTARAAGEQSPRGRARRLKLEGGDGARRTGNEYGVFDDTTGECIGTVGFDKAPYAGHKSYPTRTIRLFDSKYVGIFNTHMECLAYVKGVEVVLDYMLKAKDVKSAKSLLNHMLEAKEKPGQAEE